MSVLFCKLIGLIRSNFKRILAILLSGILCIACGQKGALYLPQQQTTQSASKNDDKRKQVPENITTVIEGDAQDY